MPPATAWGWNPQLLAAGRRFHCLPRDGGSYVWEEGLRFSGGWAWLALDFRLEVGFGGEVAADYGIAFVEWRSPERHSRL